MVVFIQRWKKCFTICKWSLLLIFILLLWSFYSAERSLRRSHETTKDCLGYPYHPYWVVFFFFSFPGIHICNQQSWFAAKSSKFAAASGTQPAFEAQPVCCASSSKQNLQKKKKTRRDQQVTWKLVNHRMHCSKKDNKKQQTNDMKKATFLENGNPYLLLH